MRSAWRKPASVLLRCVGRALQLALNVTRRALSYLANQVNFINVRFVEFVPRPSDVFIVTYPRSGTTWMQMILYQLTTGGSDDFTHIAEVCPWFERAAARGDNLERLPPVRIIKSHLPYSRIPKGPCRYIYVTRSGEDVAASYWRLYRSHLGYKGDFDAFFERFLKGRVQYGSWFEHVAGWLEQAGRRNVLHLRYEDLLRDLDGCIARIADFCGIDVDPARLPMVREKCSLAYMKRHEDKFDHATELLWEKGLLRRAFIGRGRAGEAAGMLSAEQRRRFERNLDSHLAGFGFPGARSEARAMRDGGP
ncbi:MAG: sulfotransferase domain-containing protein [Gammaproteobacteria bacterium]|nr:sulfotransferase domain-containing protein [Gammaproteobacteria bacterium]